MSLESDLIASGVGLARQGRFEDALVAFNQALDANPASADAHNFRGNVLLSLGRIDEALQSFDRAVALDPHYASAFTNRGNALSQAGRLDEALASYNRAIDADPQHLAAYKNRGSLHRMADRLDAAIEDFTTVSVLTPSDSTVFNELAKISRDASRQEDALRYVARAIELDPTYAEAFNLKGYILDDIGRFDEAIADYDRALTLQPDFVAALANRAIAFAQVGRYAESLNDFAKAAALDPTCTEVHWNEGRIRLLLGEFDIGWRKHEWRWKVKSLQRFFRNFAQPQWAGESDIAGKTILLHAEQGYGDTIQFCRYAKRVADLGANVLLEVPGPLASLLEDLAGVNRLVIQGEPLPPFDCHCPLLSLPFAFGTRLETIPAEIPYLEPKLDRVVRWSARFGAAEDLRVGIAWAGARWNENDHNRSIPLAKLLAGIPDGVQCVSLQKELWPEDPPLLRNKGIVDFSDQIGDFADTAAIMSCLDMVIAVDTAVAHLAGALGLPVWLLVPAVPDWRWMIGRADTPWYPTMRLFRQKTLGNWQPVVEAVHDALRALVDSSASA